MASADDVIMVDSSDDEEDDGIFPVIVLMPVVTWMLEVFSRPRVVPNWIRVNPAVRRGLSLDLLNGWDATRWSDRGRLLHWIRQALPKYSVLSPPCTMWSALQRTNKTRIRPEVLEARMRVAVIILQFTMQVCALLDDLGLGFVFEHPRFASSWDEPCVQEIMMLDQYRYGLWWLRPPKTDNASIYDEFHNMFCNCGDRRIEGSERGTVVAAFAA